MLLVPLAGVQLRLSLDKHLAPAGPSNKLQQTGKSPGPADSDNCCTATLLAAGTLLF